MTNTVHLHSSGLLESYIKRKCILLEDPPKQALWKLRMSTSTPLDNFGSLQWAVRGFGKNGNCMAHFPSISALWLTCNEYMIGAAAKTMRLNMGFLLMGLHGAYTFPQRALHWCTIYGISRPVASNGQVWKCRIIDKVLRSSKCPLGG